MFMACLGFLGVRLGSTFALIDSISFQTWEAAATLSWRCRTTCSRDASDFQPQLMLSLVEDPPSVNWAQELCQR